MSFDFDQFEKRTELLKLEEILKMLGISTGAYEDILSGKVSLSEETDLDPNEAALILERLLDLLKQSSLNDELLLFLCKLLGVDFAQAKKRLRDRQNESELQRKFDETERKHIYHILMHRFKHILNNHKKYTAKITPSSKVHKEAIKEDKDTQTRSR